jgi:dCMP deaminase
MIINAGISTVIIRDTADTFRVISVTDEWVLNDDSLTGTMGY